jgi:hypothetical protein
MQSQLLEIDGIIGGKITANPPANETGDNPSKVKNELDGAAADEVPPGFDSKVASNLKGKMKPGTE